MNKHDLTATSFLATRVTALLLLFLAVFFAFQPDWLGWDLLVKHLGESRMISIGVAIALVLVMALAFEKDRIRVQMAELMEALHQLLYGRDYARDREAIEILLHALDGQEPVSRRIAHENLVRLTGQNFADDPRVWRSWWETHKRTWSRALKGDVPRSPDDTKT
jgi:hypothetical protein